MKDDYAADYKGNSHARRINKTYLTLVETLARNMFNDAQDLTIQQGSEHYLPTRHLESLLKDFINNLADATDPGGHGHKLVCFCMIPPDAQSRIRWDR